MKMHLSLCFLTLISQSHGTQLILVNNCNENVWPGILPQGQEGQETPNNGGFHLPCGERLVLEAPQNWSGRIWGGRGCLFDDSGKGSCQTGDCAGLLECRGTGGQPPATLVQMTLGTLQDPIHYYDVSLVDGYNLPISMVPVDHVDDDDDDDDDDGCGIAACEADLNVACPASLAVHDEEGGVVGCKSDCLATKAPEYCCTGVYSDARICKPSIAAQMFKALCPRAYSYACDASDALHKCRAPGYVVTFCPATATANE